MKFRILSIKRRMRKILWWEFKWNIGIDVWAVKVETEDKKELEFNCWAGCTISNNDYFDEKSLIWDLKSKLKTYFEPPKKNFTRAERQKIREDRLKEKKRKFQEKLDNIINTTVEIGKWK